MACSTLNACSILVLITSPLRTTETKGAVIVFQKVFSEEGLRIGIPSGVRTVFCQGRDDSSRHAGVLWLPVCECAARRVQADGQIEVKSLNDRLEDLSQGLANSLLDPAAQKIALKAEKSGERSSKNLQRKQRSKLQNKRPPIKKTRTAAG